MLNAKSGNRGRQLSNGNQIQLPTPTKAHYMTKVYVSQFTQGYVLD